MKFSLKIPKLDCVFSTCIDTATTVLTFELTLRFYLPSNSLFPFLDLPRFFFESERFSKNDKLRRGFEISTLVILRLSSSDVSGVKSSAGTTTGGLLIALLVELGDEPRDFFPFLFVSLVSLITILILHYSTSQVS